MTWETLLLLAVVLACPISMMWMMRGRGGGHGGGRRGMRGMRGMGGMRGDSSQDAEEQGAGRDASARAEPLHASERDRAVDSLPDRHASGAGSGDGGRPPRQSTR